jgi:hypothetical protein
MDESWSPPLWLLPHQRSAAQRIAGAISLLGGALLADAVGLGKTYVALALAGRAGRATAVVPAAIKAQWTRAAGSAAVAVRLVSHEALSRGATLPSAPLVIVDEAHRFRNPATRRYHALARGVGNARVLLVTATPVVNRAADLLHLLRIFLADDGLAILGVPSIERALGARDFAAVQHAASALIVARTARQVSVRLPATTDSPVLVTPTLTSESLAEVMRRLDELEFPNIGDRQAKEILRLGLLARLSSSGVALRESLRRHLGYLDAAMQAGGRGEALSRRAARSLVRELGALQLELGLPSGAVAERPPDLAVVCGERHRILRLLDLLAPDLPDPKAVALAALVASLEGRKTLVFTGAIATARALARRLNWRRVAVVAGGRAWIATGGLGVERALELFAPRARHAAAPGQLERVDTLIATDLVSEGLDLQDAEGVVHYDLPWTPLRLAQRVGRIARLGSQHTGVTVAWFAPPPELDARLRLQHRIARKARDQMRLPVGATSVVGRATLFNRSLETRERLAIGAEPVRGVPCHAVVRGRSSVVAIEWRWEEPPVGLPEVLVFRASGSPAPADPIVLEGLLRSTVGAGVSRDVTEVRWESLLALLRRRMSSAESSPQDVLTSRLRRRMLRRALIASRRRAAREVATLDGVLAALTRGVRYGGLLELDALRAGSLHDLDQWIDHWARPPRCPANVCLIAALFGDE